MDVTQKVKQAMINLAKQYGEKKRQKLENRTNVLLGRIISSGSDFQYDFAKILFLGTRYKVLVDYPITYAGYTKSGKMRNRTMYPDITVIDEENVLKAIIELKIDLGYLREDYEKNLKSMTDAFRANKRMKYNEFVKVSGSKNLYITIPRYFIKIFIIGTKQNHKERAEPFKRVVESLGFRPLILLDNVHPNLLPKPETFEKELVELEGDISKEIEGKKEQIEKTFEGIF